MQDERQAEELVYIAKVAIPRTKLQIEQTENQIRLLVGDSPDAVVRGHPLIEQEQPPGVPAGFWHIALTTLCVLRTRLS